MGVAGGWDGLQARRELERHRCDRVHGSGLASAADFCSEVLEQGTEVDVPAPLSKALLGRRASAWQMYRARLPCHVQKLAPRMRFETSGCQRRGLALLA